MDSLDGVLTRKLYHKPSKWNPAGVPYLIGKLASGITIKGEMSDPREGESYRFWGSYQAQKGYSEDAFEFSTYDVMIDESEAGVALYLRNYVPGLGAVKAAALVEHFGADTLMVLRSTPERVTEVPRLTEANVAAIRHYFENDCRVDPVAFAKLVDLFKDFKIPRKVIVQLIKDFGSSVVDEVIRRPYSILLPYPRIGWKTVDGLALTVLDYPPDGIDRHAAAIIEALTQICDQGHTYAERADINVLLINTLGVGMPQSEAWVYVLAEQLVTADTLDQRSDEYEERAAVLAEAQGRENAGFSSDFLRAHLDDVYFRPGVKFMLPKIARAEEEIARRLVKLAEYARPLTVDIDTMGLNVDQVQAVRTIPENGVSLITGAPGTGKSYSLARVLSGLRTSGVGPIRVVAPTGKAAKRAAELLAEHQGTAGIPCTTIHKALEPKPSQETSGVPATSAKIGRGREPFIFSRNEANPLDAQIVVIDETSMVDVQLAASLLRAIAPGSRVIFVGDPNQLPSVGPGSFLRDMIDAGLPCATLNVIQRSTEAGRVVHACHAIKDGRLPSPADTISLPVENWVHIEIQNQNEIADEIVAMISPKNAFPDVLWDIQVVTPQRGKHPTACANLNRLLSLKLNPPSPALGGGIAADGASENQPGDDGSFEPMFRVGDKVIRTKNGVADGLVAIPKDLPKDNSVLVDWTWKETNWSIWETPIVNGDMGVVRDIVIGDKKSFVVVELRTPDRLIRLPMSDHHLSLAYAITCHKAQGSGFPFTIVPVHPAYYWDEKTQTGIFNREWIYTAISRAEKLLVTVGQASAIRAAISRKTVHRRQTRLVDLIHREQWSRTNDVIEIAGDLNEFVIPHLEGLSV